MSLYITTRMCLKDTHSYIHKKISIKMFKGFGYLLMIYTLYVQDCSVYKYDL